MAIALLVLGLILVGCGIAYGVWGADSSQVSIAKINALLDGPPTITAVPVNTDPSSLSETSKMGALKEFVGGYGVVILGAFLAAIGGFAYHYNFPLTDLRDVRQMFKDADDAAKKIADAQAEKIAAEKETGVAINRATTAEKAIESTKSQAEKDVKAADKKREEAEQQVQKAIVAPPSIVAPSGEYLTKSKKLKVAPPPASPPSLYLMTITKGKQAGFVWAPELEIAQAPDEILWFQRLQDGTDRGGIRAKVTLKDE